MDFGQCSISLVMTSLTLFTAGKSQHITTEQHVNASLGGTFTLNCRLSVRSILVKQVDWRWSSPGKGQETIVVFDMKSGINYPHMGYSERITFFRHSKHHVSIRVTNVKMNDMGEYTCEFFTFPNGNFQATTRVTVTESPTQRSVISGVIVVGVMICFGLGAVAAFTVLQKKSRSVQRKAAPRQSTVYENLHDLAKSDRATESTDVHPASSDSDHIYTGLQSSNTYIYSTLKIP